MEYQDVILHREKGWIEITINRPEKLNSLREKTAEEILAILNEVVWRNFSTDAWVTFKVFGIMPLTLVFALAQTPLLMRYDASRKEA